MRQRFGNWGAGLSDADFACALAAAGVLWSLQPPRGVVLMPELLASRIWLLRTPEGILPWRLTRLPPPLDARLLLESWRSFRRFAAGDGFRIGVQDSRADLRWVLKQLSRPEVGAAAVESWESPPARGRRKSPVEGSYSVREPEPGDDDYRSVRQLGGDETLEVSSKERVVREEAPPRWLQARLRSGSRDVKTLRGKGSYEAVIRIGESDARWISVEQPFPTPEEPAEREGHWLTVIFWEPRVSPDPQVQPLLLPPEGNTGEVAFPFEVPAGLEKIAARVTVLHANRVLQTGLLRAAVGDRSPWTFTLDATPRTRLEGLSARSQFDVALVLNHDDEGVARATVAAGRRAVVLDLDDGPLDALTDYLRKQISKIAKAPERYETLTSPGTLELLRTLAQKGGALHEDLCNHTDLPVLAEAKSIQVTSAKVGSFLPVELLYRYEPPDDTAALCPNAAVALQAGECPGGCPADKRQNVCPLGFWGLSRIIERHTHTAENEAKNQRGDFLLRPEPVRSRNPLALSNRSLLAASGKASEVKKEAIDELLQALAKRGKAAQAKSWPEWVEHVESDRPSLLVLLPHHEEDEGEEILEIGEGERLKSSLIRPEHVRCEDGPYPILLLLGCDTNLARIAFDSFATRFRDKKAAVVVSTIATILGRHASPAAAKLVELLDEEAREEDSTFGEVMVRLRRKLLETGSPMALGLTAYGDADWILTRQE
ncbi:MAG: hypothetical protein ACJ76J_20805 [Thermoanaerobaculia bacterium]